MSDTVQKSDELAALHHEMQRMREQMIEAIDAALTGRQGGQWVSRADLESLHQREQALNEALFAEMPVAEHIEFTPALEVETPEAVTEQLRLYIDAADPKHEGFNLREALKG